MGNVYDSSNYESMPKTAETDATATTGATKSWQDSLISGIIDLYGKYRNSKPGKYQQVPESPELAAIRRKILGYIDNSPTRDMLGTMLGNMVERNAANPFRLPTSPTYDPNGAAPKYDLSRILPTLYGSKPDGPGGQTAKPPIVPQKDRMADTIYTDKPERPRADGPGVPGTVPYPNYPDRPPSDPSGPSFWDWVLKHPKGVHYAITAAQTIFGLPGAWGQRAEDYIRSRTLPTNNRRYDLTPGTPPKYQNTDPNIVEDKPDENDYPAPSSPTQALPRGRDYSGYNLTPGR